jgi:phosphate-selective porin OprO/OprP
MVPFPLPIIPALFRRAAEAERQAATDVDCLRPMRIAMMHGSMAKWCVCLPVIVLFFASSTGAWAQHTSLTTDPGYLWASRAPQSSAGTFIADERPECWTVKEVEIQTKPSHKFRGRMFVDQIWMDDLDGPGAATDPQDNFTGFDNLRMGVTGNIYENLLYNVELELEGDEVDFKDVYAEFQNLPWVGHARIGHFKEPFGLEWVTSNRFITFMERSVATVAFVPDRNLGVELFDHLGGNERVSWFIGLFRGGWHENRIGRGDDDVGGSGDANDWAVTGRVAWNPYYDEATPGRGLLHLGLGASARRVGVDANQGGNGALGGFLEMDSRDGPVDTFLPLGTEFSVFNTELAWVHGPFSLSNECYFMDTDLGAQPWGTYVQASYFLTGENRGYRKDEKVFYRVLPYEPFFAIRTAGGVIRGRGAWQLKIRYSYLDLDEPTLAGAAPTTPGGAPVARTIGEQQNFAAGVNWYLNPYCRLMLDYVHSISNVSPGQAVAAGYYEGDHVGMRFQIDW